MKTETIGNIFGYIAVCFVCVRLLPPLIQSMRQKERIPFPYSYIVLEMCACVSYLIYATICNVPPLLITNSILLITTAVIYVYNNHILQQQDEKEDTVCSSV